MTRSYNGLMTLTATALVLAIILLILEPGSISARFLEEGGPLETFSAAGYLVVVVALFREADRDYVRRHFYFVVIPLAMCFREMDLHKAFTTMSILKSDFYLTPGVPLTEKAIGLAIILLLVLSVVLLLRRHGRAFVAGLWQGNTTAIAILLSLGCAAASKSIDGLPRKLAAFGIEVGAAANHTSWIIEETLELGVPVFMTIAVFSFFPRVTGKDGWRSEHQNTIRT